MSDTRHDTTSTDVTDATHRWLPLDAAETEFDVSARTLYRRVNAGELLRRRDREGRTEIGVPLTPVTHTTSDVRHATDAVVAATSGVRHVTADVTDATSGVRHATEPDVTRQTPDTEWRDDLLSQVADQRARAERAETAAEQQLVEHESRAAELREELAQRVELAKARQIDLERELTVRESTITDLRGQVAILEAKVRETLEAHAEKLGDLASDIAELANAKGQMELRVYELEPVASQVPMLQAAVEEKDATLSERERQLEVREHELSQVRDDIDAIASRPVTGPVFRLLTKGKLRR